MPGMRVLPRVESNASPANLAPGREVLYLGNLAGGPHHGARGVVRRIYGRKAVVDMGPLGDLAHTVLLPGRPVEGRLDGT